MQPQTNGQLTVDVCRGCGGTWYDRGELRQQLGAGPPVASAPVAASPQQPRVETTRTCPKCTAAMAKSKYRGGVIIDICSAHGAFLDPGEIEQIAAAMPGAAQTGAAQTAPTSAYAMRERIAVKTYGATAADHADRASDEVVEILGDRSRGRWWKMHNPTTAWGVAALFIGDLFFSD